MTKDNVPPSLPPGPPNPLFFSQGPLFSFFFFISVPLLSWPFPRRPLLVFDAVTQFAVLSFLAFVFPKIFFFFPFVFFLCEFFPLPPPFDLGKYPVPFGPPLVAFSPPFLRSPLVCRCPLFPFFFKWRLA